MKTLSTIYDNKELCGYIHMDNWGGIGFIELSPDDEFRYRTDDYYVVCSVVRQKPSYCHCKVHYSGNCSQCAITGDGCWTLKHGEQIIFNEH